MLVMACAILGLSFRSFSNVKTIIRKPVNTGTSRTQDVFEASIGGLSWENYEFPFRFGDYSQGCQSISDAHFYRAICKTKTCDWRFQCCSIEMGEYKVQRGLWFRCTYVLIPFHSIALALGLVSALLLLSKPRKPSGSCHGVKKWNSPRIFFAQRLVASGNSGKSASGLAGLSGFREPLDCFVTLVSGGKRNRRSKKRSTACLGCAPDLSNMDGRKGSSRLLPGVRAGVTHSKTKSLDLA